MNHSTEPRPDHDEDHHRGLAFDVGTLMARRRALGLLGGGIAAALVGCAGSSSDGSASSTSAGDTNGSSGSNTSNGSSGSSGSSEGAIPQETAGPYPGDGSNGPNVLTESGIVRKDITTSFGSLSGTAKGVPLAISLVVLDAATSKPKPGAAVYIWHCDREARYSLYTEGATDQNYLRGVQETDGDGTASFDSIFPAAYPGRWPHVHFEVYESIDAATSGGSPISTSQIALPEDICAEVYATDGYESSTSNLAQTSLESDMVFADSYERELGTMSGAVTEGLTVTLDVPV